MSRTRARVSSCQRDLWLSPSHRPFRWVLGASGQAGPRIGLGGRPPPCRASEGAWGSPWPWSCSPRPLGKRGVQLPKHSGYPTAFSAETTEPLCVLTDQTTHNGKKPTNPSRTWWSLGQPSKCDLSFPQCPWEACVGALGHPATKHLCPHEPLDLEFLHSHATIFWNFTSLPLLQGALPGCPLLRHSALPFQHSSVWVLGQGWETVSQRVACWGQSRSGQ